MAIKVKSGGAYADITGVFTKKSGAYEAVQGVFAKAGGAYGRVDAVPVIQSIGAIIFGQSELEYLFNTSGFYRQIDQPAPGAGNLIVYTQEGADVAPVRTVVNATTVAAGQVNPCMAALSALLAYVAPGKTFVVGDGAVPGTSRYELVDDSDTDRKWSDLTSVIDAVETETGAPLKAFIECWYNSDAGSIPTFKNSFWPLYFGRTGANGSFTLGSVNPDAVNTTAKFDHCLWDGAAASNAKGRGVFARDDTKWHVITPMPFLDSPESPAAELTYFSEGTPRLTEPCRATMIALDSDALAQTVGLQVGPSAHIAKFGGISGDAHPDVETADGQILLLWPFAVALLRAAGHTISEPTIVGLEGPDDGSYIDVLVDLPNGGSLTTLRALRETAAPGTEPPHYQPVVGFEIQRGGIRHPVYKTTETSYSADYRGTVIIYDPGSGTPRRGKVRITPTNAFEYGDSVSYLRGQATAVLLEERDKDALLYLNMLIEHVPALYDETATYPLEGLAVRPYQAEINVTVPEPEEAYAINAVNFDGTNDWLGTESGFSAPAGGKQMLAAFNLHIPSAWPSSGTILSMSTAGGIGVFEASLASSGRINFTVRNAANSVIGNFVMSTGSLSVDTWYTVVVAFDSNTGKGWQVRIRPSGGSWSTPSAAVNSFTVDGTLPSSAGRCRFGSASGGGSKVPNSYWADVWVSLAGTLDLSDTEGLDKFLPSVSKGATGDVPTGSAPALFLSGETATWHGNKGAGGGLGLNGSLTTAPSVPS